MVRSNRAANSYGWLSAADADVLKSHGAQLCGIEKIFRIDDDGAFQQILDFAEVQRAEFRPAGADHKRVDTFGGRVGGVAVANTSIQLGLSFGERDRVIGTHASAL